ncbi:hypothetical protein RN001_012094 [Aquatica leii]|uniref:Uncharacterized protein n=1 Tax=Aquatica leii TaxID=1421715 RepID=A0AAN7SD50_9COLE|nr:hypothetical protein RN001_012094 [Aquatica leii]
MYKRPSPDETEEDILKLQEEFFKNKSKNAIIPAAKLINENKEPIVQEKEDVQDDMPFQIANTFENIPSDINIGNVVEKVCSNTNVAVSCFIHEKGFPEAKRRDLAASTTKGSIFRNK